ncbi:MAG: hypothetical protein GY773_24325 [Actinomycetia bacterium]|nr:hypothetical protein [Actinomycetes bacterium]
MGVIGRTLEEAESSIDLFATRLKWSPEMADAIRSQMIIGDPDSFGEQIRDLMATGIDGVTANLVTVAHDPELVSLAGQVADAAIG